MKRRIKAGVMSICLAVALCMTGCSKKEDTGEFTPRLDTDEKVVLTTTGFFGNFEALDQVINDFNQYYPNVEFSYEQVSGDTFDEYLDVNPDIDIMMTSETLFQKEGGKLESYCADLAKEDIDLSAIDEKMLSCSRHDGKLSAIPMGQNMYGLIVNVSLLEKEGLSVPTNYDEFLQTLETLKSKGYTPIQGPNSKVYAELTQNMILDMLLTDQTLYTQVASGKKEAADSLQPVMDKINDMMDNGYIDPKVNQDYPEDNYDGAILKFFEGDVPFWVCNTEKVSGMKKRESKSEAFKKNPFEYEYIYAPLGEKGGYAYTEPWYGFAVNEKSDNYDYAVEFLRFLVTKNEINQIADIKGVPSVAKEKSEVAIYKNVLGFQKVELQCVNEGKITPEMIAGWYSCVNKYVTGEYSSEKEALGQFVTECGRE